MSTNGFRSTKTDTIVLIHGLWVTPRSWEKWIEHYQQSGYRVLAPAYPGLEVEVEALREDPTPIEQLTIAGTAAHYEGIVRSLETPPILIGHSFGGTVVQLLLNQGLGAAGVAIDSVPVKGVRIVPFTQAKAALPVLGHVSNRHKAVALSLAQFKYAFTNVCTPEDSEAAYRRYYVAGPGRIVWDGVLANFSSHPATEVDFGKRDRAPLLFIAGEEDHLVPPAVNRSNYRHYAHHSEATVAYKEFPGRSHFTLGEPGWEEVADYAVAWAQCPTPGDEPALSRPNCW